MRLQTIAVFLGPLIALGRAYKISPEHGNGVFHVMPNEDGNHTVTKIGEIGEAPPRDPSGAMLNRRGGRGDGSGVYCHAPSMNHEDINKAANALGNTCDHTQGDWIRAMGFTYSLSDSAVAYFCNYVKKPNHCASKDLYADIKAIDAECQGQAGKQRRSKESL